METEDIDFVIPWVDGNDINWNNDRMKYKEESNKTSDNRNIRYRDWENLKYWFRGVEQFAPWVRKVHFITYGHLPDWLNIDNPKLHIVNHKDYIPNEFLPTFSSHVIELNLYKIEGLSEKFVYFNDDTFLIKKVNQEDFFKNGLPCDSAILNAHMCEEEVTANVINNNMKIVNKYFDKNTVISENKLKWFNLIYGKYIVRTLCLMPWKKFSSLYQAHLPNAFFKSTFTEVLEKEKEKYTITCQHKFRNEMDINQWLIKDWQIVSGKFNPRSLNIGKFFCVSKNNKDIINCILKQKAKIICINDSDDNFNFDKSKLEINNALEQILNKKSKFEK